MCRFLGEFHLTEEKGNCVLVFLPGIVEIDHLFSLFSEKSWTFLEILVLHSIIEHEDQMKVFAPIPDGVTRVVLATNIAESSITIPQGICSNHFIF